jgi:hypothetical protein
MIEHYDKDACHVNGSPSISEVYESASVDLSLKRFSKRLLSVVKPSAKRICQSSIEAVLPNVVEYCNVDAYHVNGSSSMSDKTSET